MKRILAMALIFIGLLALTACNGAADQLIDDVKSLNDYMTGTTNPDRQNTSAAATTAPSQSSEVVGELSGFADPGLNLPDFVYYYLEYEEGEMPDNRAAFRLLCDGTRYMDSWVSSDRAYLNTLVHWSAEESTWDYARFTGKITWMQHTEDGYTLTMLELWPGLERQVIASFKGRQIFEVGQLVTVYGLIAMSSYDDALGNSVDCFAMEVMDFYRTGFMNAVSLSPATWSATSILENCYDTQMDWDVIPDAIFDAWFGRNHVFGSGQGDWLSITTDSINGWPYNVEYWLYQPEYNMLTLGISLEGRDEAFVPYGKEITLIWLDFQDAHISTHVPDRLSLTALRDGYEYPSTEWTTLTDIARHFYGTTMYWQDWDE